MRARQWKLCFPSTVIVPYSNLNITFQGSCCFLCLLSFFFIGVVGTFSAISRIYFIVSSVNNTNCPMSLWLSKLTTVIAKDRARNWFKVEVTGHQASFPIVKVVIQWNRFSQDMGFSIAGTEIGCPFVRDSIRKLTGSWIRSVDSGLCSMGNIWLSKWFFCSLLHKDRGRVV